MSAEQFAYIEQDTLSSPNGNELPTYDDLAAQNGPNSRYLESPPTVTVRASDNAVSIDLVGGEVG